MPLFQSGARPTPPRRPKLRVVCAGKMSTAVRPTSRTRGPPSSASHCTASFTASCQPRGRRRAAKGTAGGPCSLTPASRVSSGLLSSKRGVMLGFERKEVKAPFPCPLGTRLRNAFRYLKVRNAQSLRPIQKPLSVTEFSVSSIHTPLLRAAILIPHCCGLRVAYLQAPTGHHLFIPHCCALRVAYLQAPHRHCEPPS
jgi:hypothetical protein